MKGGHGRVLQADLLVSYESAMSGLWSLQSLFIPLLLYIASEYDFYVIWFRPTIVLCLPLVSELTY